MLLIPSARICLCEASALPGDGPALLLRPAPPADVNHSISPGPRCVWRGRAAEGVRAQVWNQKSGFESWLSRISCLNVS